MKDISISIKTMPTKDLENSIILLHPDDYEDAKHCLPCFDKGNFQKCEYIGKGHAIILDSKTRELKAPSFRVVNRFG